MRTSLILRKSSAKVASRKVVEQQESYAGAFVTMATPECAAELALFITSLRAFHPNNPVVVGTTTDMRKCILESDTTVAACLLTMSSPPHEFKAVDHLGDLVARDSNITFVPCLDQYGDINRPMMEREPGCWYDTRHTDFMMEKANLLEWTLALTQQQHGKHGALFLDSDILFLAPHRGVSARDASAEAARVELSPHGIRSADERLFGKYNGGYVWTNSTEAIASWRRHTHQSRYFDQASLEDVATEFGPSTAIAPPQVNYGYWRMFQAPRPSKAEVARFTVRPGAVCYDGVPLQSVHSHFFLPTTSRATKLFNRLVAKWAKEAALGTHHPGWAPVHEMLAPWVTK